MTEKPLSANIMLQSSDAYCPFAGVALTSLLDANRHMETIRVYYIADGLSEDNMSKLKSTALKYGRPLYVIDASAITKMLAEAGVPQYHGSYTTLLKLFVISQIKEDISTLLYVDADMLVVSPIDELIGTDLSDGVCGMVEHATALRYKTEIGRGDFRRWYNGGLVLFNVPEWKKRDCEEKIIRAVSDPKNCFPFMDEDLLNLLFHNDIVPLALKFNYPATYEKLGFKTTQRIYRLTDAQRRELEEASKGVVIYHSLPVFGTRPWDKNSEAVEKPRWDACLKNSAWSDYVCEERPMSAVNRLQRALLYILPSAVYAAFHRAAYLKLMKRGARGFSQNGEER